MKVYTLWSDSDGGYNWSLMAVTSTREAAVKQIPGGVEPADGRGYAIEEVVVDQPYERASGAMS